MNMDYLTAAIQFIIRKIGPCSPKYIRELLIMKNIKTTKEEVKKYLDNARFSKDVIALMITILFPSPSITFLLRNKTTLIMI